MKEKTMQNLTLLSADPDEHARRLTDADLKMSVSTLGSEMLSCLKGEEASLNVFNVSATEGNWLYATGLLESLCLEYERRFNKVPAEDDVFLVLNEEPTLLSQSEEIVGALSLEADFDARLVKYHRKSSSLPNVH